MYCCKDSQSWMDIVSSWTFPSITLDLLVSNISFLCAFFCAKRIMVAWQPVGLAMGVYDVCARYVKQREQFGSPLGGFQLIQERLVRMLGNIQVGTGIEATSLSHAHTCAHMLMRTHTHSHTHTRIHTHTHTHTHTQSHTHIEELWRCI